MKWVMKQRKFRQITLAFIKFHFFEGQNKVAKFRKMKSLECVNIYFTSKISVSQKNYVKLNLMKKLQKNEKSIFRETTIYNVSTV